MTQIHGNRYDPPAKIAATAGEKYMHGLVLLPTFVGALPAPAGSIENIGPINTLVHCEQSQVLYKSRSPNAYPLPWQCQPNAVIGIPSTLNKARRSGEDMGKEPVNPYVKLIITLESFVTIINFRQLPRLKYLLFAGLHYIILIESCLINGVQEPVPMRFSKKSDYALRTLIYLTLQEYPGPFAIRHLAHTNDIPYRFLQQIVLDLKANGWIATVSGREGGIMLAKPAGEITVGEVVRFFDGVLAPVGCVSIKNYTPCSQQAGCRFRGLLLDIRNTTAALMDRTTLADLATFKPERIQEMDGEEYTDGGGI